MCVCAAVLNPLPPQNSSHAPMILLVNSNETAPAQGCREPPLMWCSHVPRIYLPQLIVSLIICTFSYAMATVTCFSIFSRILGPFPQVMRVDFILGLYSNLPLLLPSFLPCNCIYCFSPLHLMSFMWKITYHYLFVLDLTLLCNTVSAMDFSSNDFHTKFSYHSQLLFLSPSTQPSIDTVLHNSLFI